MQETGLGDTVWKAEIRSRIRAEDVQSSYRLTPCTSYLAGLNLINNERDEL